MAQNHAVIRRLRRGSPLAPLSGMTLRPRGNGFRTERPTSKRDNSIPVGSILACVAIAGCCLGSRLHVAPEAGSGDGGGNADSFSYANLSEIGHTGYSPTRLKVRRNRWSCRCESVGRGSGTEAVRTRSIDAPQAPSFANTLVGVRSSGRDARVRRDRPLCGGARPRTPSSAAAWPAVRSAELHTKSASRNL